VTDSLYYVYGVIPATPALNAYPAGIDDMPVTAEPEGDVAALITRLSADDYAPASIEERSASVEWVSPRAVAHDGVLTWASDHTAVVPFPMFSAIFGSVHGVRTMLRERGETLRHTLDRVRQGREYALRIYRVDSELRASLADLSEEFRAMAGEAAKATPGQRYLLERKLDEHARGALKGVAQRIAGEVHAALSEHALETATSPIPRTAAGDAPGTMILNAAYLVAPSTLPALQHTLTALVAQYQPRGFRFAFTGPWPPYHFASTTGHDD
jgi:hypothetical protein